MSREQQDYLMRQIERFMAVLLRLRSQLAEDQASALAVADEARGAQGELLGPLAGLAAKLGPESVVKLTRDRREAELWRDLLELEAEARRAAGDVARADAIAARAEAARRAIEAGGAGDT